MQSPQAHKKMTPNSLIRSLVSGCVTIYQKTISPDHGILFRWLYPYGCCRFYPTCSQYAKEAVKKYGVFRGGALFVRRLGRCHPWSDGGIDKVR